MKPPFKPTPQLSRLEAVTATASSRIDVLEAEVAWYRGALYQKMLWERQQVDEICQLESKKDLLWFLLILSNLAWLAGATALALRWL